MIPSSELRGQPSGPGHKGPAAPMGTQVYLIDDDEGVLRSVRFLLESAHFSVATYSNPHHFLDSMDWQSPACILADYRMPAMNGLELYRAFRERGGWQPFLIVTAFGDIPTCATAIRAGVAEFLEKPLNLQTLVPRIRELLLQAQRSASVHRQRRDVWKDVRLSPREQEILDRIVAGKTMKEIAGEFGTSIQTVSKQRLRLLEKLGVDTDIKLVHLAQERLRTPTF